MKISASGLKAVSAIHKTGTIQTNAMHNTTTRLTMFLSVRDLNMRRAEAGTGRAADRTPEFRSGACLVE
ncbi:MAG: hypothetical protein Kow0063_18420 [Anaerolineae bacterium]